MERHDRSRVRLQGKFRIAVGLTSAVLIAEVIGGILTNSLALLSDAAHVFTDIFALVLSWVAIYLSTFPATSRRTYGYHRAEVFASLINGLSLIVIAGWIFYEAGHRLVNPEAVKSFQMLIVAIVGLLVNIGVALVFMKESHENLNVRSAFLHVLGDAMSSAGVIVGGAVMALAETFATDPIRWYITDPILSFAIGAVIIWGAGRITYESMHILLEGTPKNINIEDVSAEIKKFNFVKDIHDLHIWSICSEYAALSAHVYVDAQSIRTLQNALTSINNMLKDKFRIIHTTIQLECGEHNGTEPLLCNFKDHIEDEEDERK